MNMSPSIDNLAAALVRAQSKIESARKDASNPHFKRKYASLSSIWEACRDVLHENGVAVVQFPISSAEGVGVETILLHESGEWMSRDFTLSAGRQLKGGEVVMDAQSCGSAVSYARRYALAAALGVMVEDDDAEGAVRRPAKPASADPTVIASWRTLLDDDPPVNMVNAKLANSHGIDKATKKVVWGLVQKHASAKRWEWNEEAKKFVIGRESGAEG